MKNLIEEIEKRLENAKNDYSEYPVLSKNDITLGECKAYQDCLNIINNYNIITAPKQIKLSEVVESLNEEYKEKPIFQRWTKNYKTRWLYELWIAGTEIVDDLESD